MLDAHQEQEMYNFVFINTLMLTVKMLHLFNSK